MSSRVTINEIAQRAGVSKGAVSYALNGRPGVSERTRDRILDVARQVGWAPNRTARLLSESRTDTFGLAVNRDPRTLGSEPFYIDFMAGLESVLSPRSYALLLQVTPTVDAELALYHRWASERRVDAVAVVDVLVDDPRVGLLRELDLPSVFVGDPSATDGHACVWTDDASAMASAVQALADLGHRRVARVAGERTFAHVRIRDEAFVASTDWLGVAGEIAHTDPSAEGNRRAIEGLFRGRNRPTALIFDGDLMAAASLNVLHDLGISVPDQVSVLTWNDSPICEITRPPLTAMSHDVMGFGAHVGRRLFELLDGAEPANHLDSVPAFRGRGSTGPPPLG